MTLVASRDFEEEHYSQDDHGTERSEENHAVDFDVDLFVIGGGSGGVRAARVASAHGATVMLAEEYRLGGTCVIRGCVPKKLFVYAGRFADTFETAKEFGWNLAAAKFDWPALVAAKNVEVARLESVYEQIQENSGVQTVKSRAILEDANTVRIVADGRRIRAKVILIATGAKPEIPRFEGVQLGITSNEIFDMESFPKKLVIGGAGYIAIEFAGLFAELGSEVTVVCKGDNILRGFDEDLRHAVAASYRRRGITLILRDSIRTMRNRPMNQVGAESVVDVVTEGGARLIANKALLAFGRSPNTANLGLEKAGVAVNARGAIIVDAMSRTSVNNIYAIGDVTDQINLTPVAIRQGHAFADSIFGPGPRCVDLRRIPTAVFSSPEIGAVGLTELEARSSYAAVETVKAFARLPARERSDQALAPFLKAIFDVESGKLLGVHIFGDNASEMIQVIATCLLANITKDIFMSYMASHAQFGDSFADM